MTVHMGTFYARRSTGSERSTQNGEVIDSLFNELVIMLLILKWRLFWLLLALGLSLTLGASLENKSHAEVQQLIACQQPKAPGLCRGRQLRYAYNKETGNCESFYYTGCASTENNFLTFEECRRDCMQRLRY
ncbi:kunitz-type serine protease inhibitor vestiginin-3 [Drosophila persimilis]|nr:kunitz-type serine protease inhibitor vestiginin-3 [Drosophila persimilis]